ncbi:phage head closure protein [Massilia sp. DD77]|uniref:phage head closure protein n=1 Tax=Massilia sp. DD77 TaxID=3109349 RepID=UPI003000ED83
MTLNHRVMLLKPGVVRNAANERVNSFEPVQEVWASVRFQTGAEVMRAGADVSIVKCSVRIRARSDVDASWRVRYKGVDYEVKSPPLEDSKGSDFVFLVCEGVK